MDSDDDNYRDIEVSVRPGRIQSVARALAILDVVADRRRVRAQEVASALDLNLTTTVHLMNTLVDGGYLVKQGRTYSWSADRVLSLYAQMHEEFTPSRRALDALRQVTEASGESGYVSYWTGNDVMIMAVAEGSHAVRVAGLQVGLAGDVHARSSGKALLAFGPPSRVENLLRAGPLRRRTPNTIIEPDALRDELTAIRKRGYAIDREEYLEGVWGIAVPLPDVAGAPSTALTITMPAHRFQAHRAQLIAALLDAAKA